MTTIPYSSGDTIHLVVTSADNLLVGYLDGSDARQQVYDRTTDNAISFTDTIDIGPRIGDTPNLVMTGTNFGGGGQITFAIQVNGTAKANVSENLGTFSSKSWSYKFQEQ